MENCTDSPGFWLCFNKTMSEHNSKVNLPFTIIFFWLISPSSTNFVSPWLRTHDIQYFFGYSFSYLWSLNSLDMNVLSNKVFPERQWCINCKYIVTQNKRPNIISLIIKFSFRFSQIQTSFVAAQNTKNKPFHPRLAGSALPSHCFEKK